MPYKSIKEVFEHECPHLKADMALYKAILAMESGFVNKKREHMEFFGGHLTGVHVVRFTTEDKNKLFNEILMADESALEHELHSLASINKDFNVSSDVFNISSVYLMHVFHTSPYLSEEQRYEAKVRVTMYLQYKFLTSRLFQHFRYPANRDTAEATYAALSKKYALKYYGSWGAALRARAEEVVNPTGIHGQTIAKLDDDYRVVYMLNDVQGRIRDMLKNIYSVFINIHNSGVKITQSSSVIEIDGDMILKDKKNSLAEHNRYIQTIFPDKHSLIKPELVKIIYDAIDTLYPGMLEKALYWASENYTYTSSHIKMPQLLTKIIEHAHAYFNDNKDLIKHKDDLPGILRALKGAYMSSRSTEVTLLELRSDVSTVVKAATQSRNDSAIAAARTGFMLYVVLRAFTMGHYAH
jgi:hypothetical protein